MCRFNLLALLSVILVLGVPGAGSGGALRGQGDFEFYMDIASIPTGGEKTLELFQIAVPTKEVEYKRGKDGAFHAEVRIRVRFSDRDGIKVFEKGYLIRDDREEKPAEMDLSGFIYLSDSCFVSPGFHNLDVRVEDRKRKKKTLVGLLRKKYLASEIKGQMITVPRYAPGMLALGDPVFIWSKSRKTGYVPNPMQIYGLKKDTLSFFVSAVLPETANRPRLRFRTSVLSSSGELMDLKETETAVHDGKTVLYGFFDVNMYPSGTYRIFIEAGNEGGPQAMMGKDFSVAWELVNWQKPQRDILFEARVLLADDEFTGFRMLSLGDQEKVLGEFWKKLDPTPHTANNETLEKFNERVRYTDRNFGNYARGALSERGQIYIRFGPPDEIIGESVPTSREDLEEAVEKLESEYSIIERSVYSERRGYESSLPRIYTNRNFAFRGTEGFDAGAYELWLYNLNGDPILPRDQLMTVRKGRRFLFVDKDGHGEYFLVGTSEDFNN